jgi:beta-RFAP synthase
MNDASPAQCVEVFAPARLHLGFLDLHGGLGRDYGSIGLTIDGIGTRVRLEPSLGFSSSGPASERAADFLDRAVSALGTERDVRLTIACTAPEHAGLGSGTQLGLAVATALARLHGVRVSTAKLATMVERGGRSGIGIGAFDLGGFLVDGGRSANGKPAPIVARLDFPAAWRMLLTLDRARNGLHGVAEKAAFAGLPQFEEALADRLCRVVLMRLLPGLADVDFTAVSGALAEIQDRIGRYFAPAQSGPYSSPAVAEVQAWLRAQGMIGLGQSSWGPTGFALMPSDMEGERLLAAARKRFGEMNRLEFRLVAGRNRGADITMSRRTNGSDP